MPVPLDKFAKRLAASGLISAESLERLLSDLPAPDRPQDGEALAKWLVREKHLTPYQAKEVFRGRTKGLVLGNYVILDRIGAGGMGQVLKAEHQRMKRTVALKVLPEDVSEDKSLIARFQREVQAAAKLMHPNIVTAFDADEADGTIFLVMEYVPGKDLATIVKQHGPLPVDQAISCILDAARGLEYAHANCVIHRDIKPANLLMASGGRQSLDASNSTDESMPESHSTNRGTDVPRSPVKILDMGLARIEDAAADVATQAELTGTGMVMGTIDYMAPEQALNTKSADHRSDIYSLGITLYYLLTGRPAYPGDSVMERLIGHRESPIPSLRSVRATVPKALDELFARMVAKQPDDRCQSMNELVQALEAIQAGGGSPSPIEETAINVTDTGDSALQSFLNAMDSGTATQPEVSAGPTRVVTETDEIAETIVAEAEGETATVIKQSATQPIATRKSRQPKWLWPSIIGGGMLTLLAILIPILSGPDHPAEVPDVPDGSEGVQASSTDQTPLESNSPDRHLAEAVLVRGGEIHVRTYEGKVREISDPGVLPNDEFALVQVALLQKADPPLTDADLQGVRQLTTFSVRSPEITDTGLLYLAENPGLDQLYLDSARVTGSGIAVLGKLSQLSRLKLISCNAVGEDAVDSIRSLTELGEVELRRTSMSQAAVESLHAALPNCTIVSDFGTFGPTSAESRDYALAFDGVDDYVVIPLRGTKLEGDYTVEAWVDLQDLEAPRHEHDNFVTVLTWNDDIQITLNQLRRSNVNGGTLSVTEQRPGSWQHSYSAEVVLGRTHVAVVSLQGKVSLFVNGQLCNTPRGISSPAPPVADEFTLGMGGKPRQFFTGRIDEVHVSRYARYILNFEPVTHFTPDEKTLMLFHCDEGSGSTLTDASGNGYVGTIHGATWEPLEDRPQPDAALAFDGVDDYVEILSLNLDDFPESQPLTIEATLKIEAPQVSNPINWLGRNWIALFTRDGHFGAGRPMSNGSHLVEAPLNEPLDQEHRVAIVWDASQWRLFLDGTLMETSPVGFPLQPTEGGLYFGGAPLEKLTGHDSPRWFAGTIDEIRLSKSARYDSDYTPLLRLTADADTLALYHFDEAAGALLSDASGNGHDGVIHGARWVTIDRPGKVTPPATSLRFDGIDDYAEIPDLPLDPTGPLTVEAIINLPRTLSKEQVLCSNLDAEGVDLAANQVWSFRVGNARALIGRSAGRVQPGRQHIAAVHDAGQIRIFCDGVEQQPVAGGAVSGSGRTDLPMLIGARRRDEDGGQTAFFNGTLHALRFSQTARYVSNFDPPDDLTADPDTLAIYRLHEDSGSILKDTSGNGHDGTIHGAQWPPARAAIDE